MSYLDESEYDDRARDGRSGDDRSRDDRSRDPRDPRDTGGRDAGARDADGRRPDGRRPDGRRASQPARPAWDAATYGTPDDLRRTRPPVRGRASSPDPDPLTDPYPADPYATDPYPPSAYGSGSYQPSPYPADPYPANPYPANPYPANPYPADPYPPTAAPPDRYPSEPARPGADDLYPAASAASTYPPDTYPPDTYAPDKYGPDKYGPDKYGPESYAPDSYSPDSSGASSYASGMYAPEPYPESDPFATAGYPAGPYPASGYSPDPFPADRPGPGSGPGPGPFPVDGMAGRPPSRDGYDRGGGPGSADQYPGGLPSDDAGGPEPSGGRTGRNLPAAIGVGVLLGGIAVASLFVWRPAFLGVLIVAVGIGVWELVRAIRTSGASPPLIPLVAGGALMMGLAWWGHADALTFGLMVTVLAAMVWRLADGSGNYGRDVSAATLIAVYLPFLAGFAALLATPPDGDLRVLVTLAGVVLSDTGGYIAGVLFGRHPMAPSVSPKKSWEGLVGSLLATAVGGALLLHFLFDVSFVWGAVFGLAVCVAAVLGDLGESMLKRDLGVKDMSQLLPGHGGLMDRLDSIVFAAPTAYLLLLWLVPPL